MAIPDPCGKGRGRGGDEARTVRSLMSLMHWTRWGRSDWVREEINAIFQIQKSLESVIIVIKFIRTYT